MKRILFGIVGPVVLMIIGLSSCKKENVYPVISTGYSQPHFVQSGTVEVIANNWVNYGGPIYVNTFKDIIAPVDGSNNRQVSIYLDENGKLTDISHEPVNYMGNDLWAISTQVDIDIIYKCLTKLPFTELHIRVDVDRKKFH